MVIWLGIQMYTLLVLRYVQMHWISRALSFDFLIFLPDFISERKALFEGIICEKERLSETTCATMAITLTFWERVLKAPEKGT